MRGLIVPTDDEPLVHSRRDWNAPGTIAGQLGCLQVARISLPPALAGHMALLIEDDQRLESEPVNLALTALLHNWSGGHVYAGHAIFVGLLTPSGPFGDLGIVAMWRLCRDMVLAQRKQLTA